MVVGKARSLPKSGEPERGLAQSMFVGKAPRAEYLKGDWLV